MGFINRINKDKVVRKNFKLNEFNRLIMKYNLNLYFLSNKYKNFLFYSYIKRFHLNSSSSRIVNTCVISGRSHWVIRKFRMSRMTFHQLADYGSILGIRRASW
jgi:small subunit ribosomal protein S14